MAEQGDAEARAELDAAPPLPRHAAHLWDALIELNKTRAVGIGPSPLTRLEIRQWEQDEGVSLDRWERRALLTLDRAWLAAQAPSKGG